MRSWSIWFIGNSFHCVQVLQHMLHLTYRLKAFFGSTPNSFHYHRCQSRREVRLKSQDRRRVLTNMLIHDSKGTLALERCASTEHLIENDPHSIDVRTGLTAFALQLFR